MSEATKEISEAMKKEDQSKAQTVLMYNNLISQSMIIGQTLVADYKTLLESQDIAEKVKERMGPDIADYVVKIEINHKSCIIEVQVRSTSPQVAADVANTMLSVFQEEQERLMGVRFFSPIQYATVPQVPYFPKKGILLL